MKTPRPEEASKLRHVSKHNQSGEKQDAQPGKKWKHRRVEKHRRKIAEVSRRRNRY